MPTFRPFDASDWQAYAGCESANPLIAETHWGELVLDGSALLVLLHHKDEPAPLFARTFATERAARHVADRLAADEQTALSLTRALGAPVGLA